MKSSLGEYDLVAIVRGDVDAGIERRPDAQPRGLHRQVAAEEPIVLIHIDRRAGGGLQLFRAADVVDVGMGDHDGGDVKLVPVEDGLDLGEVVTRIDDYGLARGFISKNGAVALQWSDGQDF